MALTHKQKVKMAHKMITKDEQYQSLFQSLAWRKRKWQIMQRVKRQQIRSKYYSEVRSGERKSNKVKELVK